MTGVTSEIERVRGELADIDSRLTVVRNTWTRLTTEIGQLQQSRERLEVWLVALECQLTTDEKPAVSEAFQVDFQREVD